MPSFGPVLAVGNIVQVTSWCQTTDQAGLNLFHYKVVSVLPTDTPLSFVRDKLQAAGYGAALAALLSVKATYLGSLYRVLKPTLSLNVPDDTGNAVGTVAGDMLPRQVAGFFRKKSSVAGRRKGGRYYIPFPGEGDSDANSIPTNGYLARLDTLAAILTSSLVTTVGADSIQLDPLIYNRKVPADSSPWNVFQHIQAWATQRRRGSFGKTNAPPF